MELNNDFEIPLPPDDAWPVLMDIPRIAPLMPGAELTEVVDEKNFKGRISVRLGPMAMAFGGTVSIVEINDTEHRARVRAQGADQKGRGSAKAEASFCLEEVPQGSLVRISTDLQMTGAVAQFGRSAGVIQAAAAALTDEFARNLRAEISQARDTGEIRAGEAAKPISVMSLFWQMIRRMFGK
jgi:hypothetical protein